MFFKDFILGRFCRLFDIVSYTWRTNVEIDIATMSEIEKS